MLTFEQIYTDTQEMMGDTSTATLALIKKFINIGAKKFGAVLNREYRNSYKTFSIVADQQFYQLPEDCIKLTSVKIEVGDITYPLTEIVDELTWNRLNMRETTSSTPEFYYVKGNDEVGIYPIPTAAIANGGTINYERRMRDMSTDDYDTGTIAVTVDSAAVVGSGTTFTALMVDRYIKIVDPSGDGMWYKVAAYTDATHITLENSYAGATASGLSYVIGEVPDLPEEYHESLEDYACFRLYLRRRDRTFANDYKNLYEESLNDCKVRYGSKTSSNYIAPVRLDSDGYVHRRGIYGVE